MSLRNRVFGTKLGQIAVLIAFAGVVIFAGWQYAVKEKYKSYVSYKMDADMRHFVDLLNTGDQIYSTILEEGAINSRQSFLLMYVHEEMAKIVPNYRDLAVRLGLRDDSFRYDQSTLNAYKIVRFFHGREDPSSTVTR